MEHLFNSVPFQSKYGRIQYNIYAHTKIRIILVFVVYVQFVPVSKFRIFLIFDTGTFCTYATKIRIFLIFVSYVHCVPETKIRKILNFDNGTNCAYLTKT